MQIQSDQVLVPLNQLGSKDVLKFALPKFSGVELPKAPAQINPFDSDDEFGEFEDFVEAS